MNPKLILQSDSGLSSWACAAKNIKTELAHFFPGIKFSVRSDSYSMGNAVRIHWDNGPTSKEVDKIVGDYEYGTFDGMTDCSGVKHHEKHKYGSAKHVTTSRQCRELTEQIEAALKPHYRQEDHYSIFNNQNVAWRIASRVSMKAGQKFAGIERQSGTMIEECWKVLLTDDKPAPVEAPAIAGQIIKTRHTQKLYDLFVVQLPQRVGKEVFAQYMESARMLGGWWSSYSVGGAVVGFQFKQERGAQDFLKLIALEPGTPEKAETMQAIDADHHKRQAAKLRELADGMEETIDSKLNSATSQQNPTPRRLRIAEGMRANGRSLQRTQAALRRIADALEAGEELPFDFLTLRWSKTVVHDALHGRGLPGLVNWLKAVPKIEEDPAKKRIREIEESFVGQKMPGYFPTPPELVERMLAHVPDKEGLLILEPSAGSGSIACALNHGSTVHCCEIRPALAELLKLKGQNVIAGDFADYNPGPVYDVVVMNPPFEHDQAPRHILKAWDCLKPGGRLVAIAPESIMFKDAADCRELRDWIEEHNAEIEDIEAGAFEKSGTMVKTRMVIATKD